MVTNSHPAGDGPTPKVIRTLKKRPYISTDERFAQGKSLREKFPRQDHAVWSPPADRIEPIAHLEQSGQGRIPELLPIRHGRMLKSPFTFFRGAAQNMAADLAGTPVCGLRVQACGDCHLLNFGAYATPERRVVFDINDLDETLPAPWEWDVKRLAASFVLACRDNGFVEGDARDAALACVRSYRERMHEYAGLSALEVWYASISAEDVIEGISDEQIRKRARKRVARARERSVLEHEFPEMVINTTFGPTIREQMPLIFHQREVSRDEFESAVRGAFAAYRETLPEHRRVLLDRYHLMDIAVKVVGVGSVGTLCSVLLLMAADNDPLFLQVKQARPSVLEPFAGKSAYANHGQRVVAGYHLMQSASDLFLGWTEGKAGRHFYLRQLRDMKIKPMVEAFTPSVMNQYGEVCGWALARAHARSGEPAMIAGYLGSNDKFDEAVADFSVSYADQTERDHATLVEAVRAGKIDVFVEEES